MSNTLVGRADTSQPNGSPAPPPPLVCYSTTEAFDDRRALAVTPISHNLATEFAAMAVTSILTFFKF